MKLNKLLGACLLMQPYDSFIYSKLMQDSQDDKELTQKIVNEFNIIPEVYNNLHVAQLVKDRYEIFRDKFDQYKVETKDFTIGNQVVIVKRISDESSFCILVMIRDKNYIIY